VKLIRIPIKCVIKITESFKIACDFFDFITGLNELFKSINPDEKHLNVRLDLFTLMQYPLKCK